MKIKVCGQQHIFQFVSVRESVCRTVGVGLSHPWWLLMHNKWSAIFGKSQCQLIWHHLCHTCPLQLQESTHLQDVTVPAHHRSHRPIAALWADRSSSEAENGEVETGWRSCSRWGWGWWWWWWWKDREKLFLSVRVYCFTFKCFPAEDASFS